MVRFVLVSLAIGCADPARPAERDDAGPTAAVPSADDLEITYLGVGGYLIRFRDDVILTPPLYSNPDFFETTFGSVATDPALVEAFGGGVPFEDVDGVLIGHAHYDHLMDLPTIWPRTDAAMIYGNASARHLLAAYAPDRAADCTGAPQDVVIPRDRVFQLDDPVGELGRDVVDYRGCGGGGDGEWVAVEGTNVRFRALCSVHPDQIGAIHFGQGVVEADVCSPPSWADDWREGQTLAFVVDFLGEDGAPVHRVYYQDAPTDPPIGLPDPELLDERAVDVALLNVGSFPSVADHPTRALGWMTPRYTIGGHWEDFFRTQDLPYLPILGHDVDEYVARAEAAMVGDAAPVWLDDLSSDARQWVPDPGATFAFPADGR